MSDQPNVDGGYLGLWKIWMIYWIGKNWRTMCFVIRKKDIYDGIHQSSQILQFQEEFSDRENRFCSMKP